MPPSPPRGKTPPDPGKRPAPSRSVEDKAANAMLVKAVQRLEDIVEQETAALRSRTPVDLGDFNNRKNHGLLELDRALRMLGGAAPNEEVKQALRRLRDKLDANSSVLKTHLEAVREVAAIIADAIRSADSDGTYSLSFRSKGQAP